MAEYSEEEKRAFRQDVERKKLAGRKIDPTLTCVACRYQVTESMAKQFGYTTCPNCGSTQVTVSTLAYNPAVPQNSIPSVQEAEQQSRSQRPWTR